MPIDYLVFIIYTCDIPLPLRYYMIEVINNE